MSEKDILPYGDRQGIGPLENHSNLFANLYHFHIRTEDIFSHHIDVTGNPYIIETFVDAINGAQEGTLAATGRADHRSDHALFDIQINIKQCLEGSIPEVQLPGTDGQVFFCARVLLHQPNLPST